MNNVEFLQWIYDRLVNVHGENESYDYMHKFKAIIANYDKYKITLNRKEQSKSTISVRPLKGSIVITASTKASQRVVHHHYRLAEVIKKDKDFPNYTMNGVIEFKDGKYTVTLKSQENKYRYYEVTETNE